MKSKKQSQRPKTAKKATVKPTSTPSATSATTDGNGEAETVEKAASADNEEEEARIARIMEWKSGMIFAPEKANMIGVLREIAALFGLGVRQNIRTVQNMPELVNRFRWLTKRAGTPLSASAAAASNAAFRDMCEQMGEYIQLYLIDEYAELYDDDSYRYSSRVSEVLLKSVAQFAAVEQDSYFVSQAIVGLWQLLRLEASRFSKGYYGCDYINELYSGRYEQTDGKPLLWTDELSERGVAAYEQFFSAFEAQRQVIAEELAQLNRIADRPQEPVAATQVESAPTEPTSNGKARMQWRRFDRVVIPILIEKLGFESERDGANTRIIFPEYGHLNYDAIGGAIQLAHNEANANPGKNSPMDNRLIHEAYQTIVAAGKTKEYIESLRLHYRRQKLRGQ